MRNFLEQKVVFLGSISYNIQQIRNVRERVGVKTFVAKTKVFWTMYLEIQKSRESSKGRGWPGVCHIKTYDAKPWIFWILHHKIKKTKEILTSEWG